MTRQVKWLTLATGYGNVWHGPAYWRLNMLKLKQQVFDANMDLPRYGLVTFTGKRQCYRPRAGTRGD